MYTRRHFELKISSCKHQPRKKRTDSTAFKIVLNLRAFEPPKAIVNRILEMTHDILDTARAITNLAPARTTASPQRERQTSQTGKGGGHDQDPLHHHHQTTREPHHDQRMNPSTANKIAVFEKEPQQSRVQTSSNNPSSNPQQTIVHNPTLTKPPTIAT